MEFSWNKWRQYVIEEASVNEMDTYESEMLGLFKFAVQLGVLEPQDYSDVEKVAMDPDAYEEGLDFNAVAATKMVKALTKIFNIVSPTVSSSASRIYDKLQGGEELDGTDLGNALQIYKKFQDQEAGNTSPEDLDAAADKLGSMEEGIEDLAPSASPDRILKHFIEDFDIASHSTDDIPYAQEQVVKIYKEKFPLMDQFIDLWLEQNHNKELKKFQNVADDPEVGGMDMMEEDDAIDEAINEMALDRAMGIANKLDAMQNDLEATLSQDEIDTLSDAIVLLRQK